MNKCHDFAAVIVRLTVALLLLRSPANASPAFSFAGLFPQSPFSPTATSEPRTAVTVSKTPVVICPGFGNDEVDYVNPLNQGDEFGFVSALIRRGFDPDLIFVLPLKRYEWIRVAGGLLDVPDFYKGTARPDGLGYGWYLKRLRKVVNDAYDAGGRDGRVLLIGHSAGGWLARAALGDGSWEDEGPTNGAGEVEATPQSPPLRASDRVRSLITVGAVHRPPAGDAAKTCVTRGALAYVDDYLPGAFLADEGIAYVSVGGDAIRGKSQESQRNNARNEASKEEKNGTQEANAAYAVRGEGSASSVAYTSYEAVSGSGELTGDGVVPLKWTLLEGSRTIVLDGVVHSINEAGTTIPTDRWYGSEGVVDRWLKLALDEAGIAMENKGNRMSGQSFKGLSFFENILPRGSSNQT